MLDKIMKRWLDLLFWWLPKNERSQSERPERARQAPSAGTTEAAPGRAETPAAKEARSTPAEERPAAPEQPPAAAKERPAAAATTPPRPDDLTVIKGIGPAVQEKLRGLGIATFGDLAAADPDRLLDQLKGSQPVSKARVQGWTEEARARSAPD